MYYLQLHHGSNVNAKFVCAEPSEREFNLYFTVFLMYDIA